MRPLKLLILIALVSVEVFAWEGKVFQVEGKKVTIASSQTSGVKNGTLLYVVKDGKEIGQGRVAKVFHTKIEIHLTKGSAEKGLVVTTLAPARAKTEPVKPANEPLKVIAIAANYLNLGWDIRSIPGKTNPRAEAGYKIIGTDKATPKKVRFFFRVKDAESNHEYTVGMHLINEGNFRSAPPAISYGYQVGIAGSEVARDGTSALVTARDFGMLKTDAEGNGSAEFEYDFAETLFTFQYSVRTGMCRPDLGQTSGCNVVFQSGLKFGESLILFKIP